jgi:pimeloyl-ACP methyl ester carboxylesterase
MAINNSLKPSRSEFVDINGVRYHVRLWGADLAPRLFLLHGWMDVSASFQFLVDALKENWLVVAPDWRGFGLSSWSDGHAYYFSDYLADLDVIVDRYQPEGAVNLFGHSMGGNIAGLFAGTRPARVRRLLLAEGFGLRPKTAADTPGRYAKWLDQLRTPVAFRPYENFDALAQRLIQNNPRLSAERAQFLARHWGKQSASGQVELISDPRHKLINPYVYRLDEAMACWRNIEAPVLWLRGADSGIIAHQTSGAEDYQARKACFRKVREAVIEDCGHMLHFDQPEKLAAAVEEFFAG